MKLRYFVYYRLNGKSKCRLFYYMDSMQSFMSYLEQDLGLKWTEFVTGVVE